MLVMALASVSIVITLMGRLAGGSGSLDQKKVQLAGAGGIEAYPAISPDGKQVAYSGRESAKNASWHVYVRDLPSGAPKQLTRETENDVAPVWSPDGGALGFQRIGEDKVQYIVIPADGGAERKIAEFSAAPDSENPSPAVSWTPDGKSLVVVQTVKDKPSALAVVDLATGHSQRITNPPDGTEGDTSPVVAPAGDAIAFVRATTSDGGDIWVCDIHGENPRRVTFDDHSLRGLVWTRDGSELIYSANRVHGWHLWRIPSVGGSPRDVAVAGQAAYYPAIGRNRLAYTDAPTVSSIWRGRLSADGIDDERMLIRSSGRESQPVYSPDGSRIATVSGETGNEEIFIQDAEGKNRFQLTRLNRPRMGRIQWSPDGKSLIFEVRGDQGSEIWVIGAVAGAQPARVIPHGSEPSFSQNGKTIYYRDGAQVWKAQANGSNPEAVVREGGASQPAESADGKYLIFRFRRTISRIPVTGGEPEEFIVPDHEMFWTNIQPTRKGVYYLVWDRSARGVAVVFFDYSTKHNTIVSHGGILDRNAGAFSVSPDGKYILFPRTDRSQTSLVVVDNFK